MFIRTPLEIHLGITEVLLSVILRDSTFFPPSPMAEYQNVSMSLASILLLHYSYYFSLSYSILLPNRPFDCVFPPYKAPPNVSFLTEDDSVSVKNC